MLKPLLSSSIDVALWFMEQATQNGVHILPMRLQHLLFLAQLVFAERYQGAKLMPASFIVRNGLPIETNVFRVFESGRPLLGRARVPGHVEIFLEEMWQQQNSVSMQSIEQALLGNTAYRRISGQGEGSEVTFDDMRAIAALEYQSHAVVGAMQCGDPAIPQKESLPDSRVIKAWTPRVTSLKKHFSIETSQTTLTYSKH